MPFDDATRGTLQSFVGEARDLLTAEFVSQLQHSYGMDPGSGAVAGLDRLADLDDQRLETARVLRDILDHYLGGGPDPSVEQRRQVLERIAREQAFTVLNRLAALRMMEARGILLESVAKGYQSKAFQLYQRVAGAALGETGEAYRIFLFSVFDMFVGELPALFDRHSPFGRLFPSEPALLRLLGLVNAEALDGMWREDETIGWIYQYFNAAAERKRMRKESGAPRNSRELAVRNQFFTPRYVVEFLVDNTLARQWFDQMAGRTGLVDTCRFLVLRPEELTGDRPARPRDPRSLKLLDPACGSMHFGLYAFDVFQTIYHEAWAFECANGPGSLTGAEGLTPLTTAYADEAAFRREVPRLILERNIYGVDIDPRATQIASLALWLRAQRAWNAAGVKPDDRPAVGRGNVVAAVAPPAELDLRRALMARMNPLDAELFERTLVLLKDLPELGVLLQTERAVPALVREVFGEHGALFRTEDETQWLNAERRLRRALDDFAHVAAVPFRNRLFTRDALEGLRLIGLVAQPFDVVVMNPPFGMPPKAGNSRFISSGNLYVDFVMRTKKLGANTIGCITDRTFLTQASFEQFREELAASPQKLYLVADLGWGVLDADVQVCAYVMRESASAECGFCDARQANEKESALLQSSGLWLYKPLGAFSYLPGAAFSYSLPSSVLDKALRWGKLSDIANLPRGLGSNKAERTYLAWYEVKCDSIGSGKRWASLANGGDFSPFWRQDLGVADWRTPKGSLWVEMTSGDGWRPYDQSGISNYFIEGLSFPKQSSVFHASILPKEFVPTREGKAILPSRGINVFALLAYLNSSIVRAFVRDTCGLHKQSGAIGEIPVPELKGDMSDSLERCARGIATLICNSYSFDETSRVFVGPNVIFDQDATEIEGIHKLEDEINRIVIELFELSVDDIPWAESQHSAFFESSPIDVVSWAVGVAFGRFDIRLVTGERAKPPHSNLFAPLLAKSPGMVPDGDPPFHLHPGILVDDRGHRHDLAHLIETVLERVAVEVAVEVRAWLRREFFPMHLKLYSKSRRKAPIYWPLATASGSYTLWLYYPALTDQTLFLAANDFVEPRLDQVARAVQALKQQTGRSRDEEKTLEAQEALADELRALRAELLRLAPIWKPNHDDGVQITAAPLWRLFRFAPWQKLLKETWETLEQGDYDWAHLAMTWWPDRVREKCRSDKSLAIAHDLESLYQPPAQAAGKTPARRGRKAKG
ncbi:MAG: hypothetical protein GC191_09825 [Azospirillum sp.]|nr:hypothetical protein [Azospirillum sp.]